MDLLQGWVVMGAYKELGLGAGVSEPGPREHALAGVSLASAGLVSLPRGVGPSCVVRTCPVGKQGSGRAGAEQWVSPRVR